MYVLLRISRTRTNSEGRRDGEQYLRLQLLACKFFPHHPYCLWLKNKSVVTKQTVRLHSGMTYMAVMCACTSVCLPQAISTNVYSISIKVRVRVCTYVRAYPVNTQTHSLTHVHVGTHMTEIHTHIYVHVCCAACIKSRVHLRTHNFWCISVDWRIGWAHMHAATGSVRVPMYVYVCVNIWVCAWVIVDTA